MKLVIAGVVISAAVLVGFRPAPSPSTEVLRIQAHFDSVLVEFAARDVTSLTAEQLSRRSALVSTLSSYRDRGIFPNNYDFAEATPYFVDRKTGTLCAMAHLLESTGRRDIVHRVADANNNVWVAQLAGDQAFGAWLDQHGLTLAEAARIQPGYMWDTVPEEGHSPTVQRTSFYSVAGASIAGATSLVNLLSNRDGHGRLRNIAGLASGIASLGYGAVKLRDPSATPGMAIANIATGAISAFVSGRGVFRHRQMLSAQRDAEHAKVTVAPIVPSASGAGVSVNVRF